MQARPLAPASLQAEVLPLAVPGGAHLTRPAGNGSAPSTSLAADVCCSASCSEARTSTECSHAVAASHATRSSKRWRGLPALSFSRPSSTGIRRVLTAPGLHRHGMTCTWVASDAAAKLPPHITGRMHNADTSHRRHVARTAAVRTPAHLCTDSVRGEHPKLEGGQHVSRKHRASWAHLPARSAGTAAFQA